jgi:hypothetical protein
VHHPRAGGGRELPEKRKSKGGHVGE